MPAGEVDNSMLREAFIASGLRPVDVARRLGWTAPYGRRGQRFPDGPRVSRTLGLIDCGSGHRRRMVTYDTALSFARVLGLDPVDLGL